VLESLEFWKKRQAWYPRYLYEKTPLFWLRYFQHEGIHPRDECSRNVKILQLFEHV
jgi:hypothetical protein